MSNPTSPAEGDAFRVTITEQDGDVVIRSGREYDFRLLDPPPLEGKNSEEIAVTITNTWYSSSGELNTVFVSPSNNTVEATTDAHRASEKNSKSSSGTQTAGQTGSSGTTSKESVSARSSQQRQTSKSADGSLQDIADELIGEEEFEVTGDEESSISAAKKKAKNQGRDPAIDPKLRDRN